MIEKPRASRRSHREKRRESQNKLVMRTAQDRAEQREHAGHFAPDERRSSHAGDRLVRDPWEVGP